jgi:translation initiation factor IF-3
MAHRELGMEMLKRVEKDLEEYGLVEQFPKMEGRQMIMVIGPVKREKGVAVPIKKEEQDETEES